MIFVQLVGHELLGGVRSESPQHPLTPSLVLLILLLLLLLLLLLCLLLLLLQLLFTLEPWPDVDLVGRAVLVEPDDGRGVHGVGPVGRREAELVEDGGEEEEELLLGHGLADAEAAAGEEGDPVVVTAEFAWKERE